MKKVTADEVGSLENVFRSGLFNDIQGNHAFRVAIFTSSSIKLPSLSVREND